MPERKNGLQISIQPKEMRPDGMTYVLSAHTSKILLPDKLVTVPPGLELNGRGVVTTEGPKGREKLLCSLKDVAYGRVNKKLLARGLVITTVGNNGGGASKKR